MLRTGRSRIPTYAVLVHETTELLSLHALCEYFDSRLSIMDSRAGTVGELSDRTQLNELNGRSVL